MNGYLHLNWRQIYTVLYDVTKMVRSDWCLLGKLAVAQQLGVLYF